MKLLSALALSCCFSASAAAQQTWNVGVSGSVAPNGTDVIYNFSFPYFNTYCVYQESPSVLISVTDDRTIPFIATSTLSQIYQETPSGPNLYDLFPVNLSPIVTTGPTATAPDTTTIPITLPSFFNPNTVICSNLWADFDLFAVELAAKLRDLKLKTQQLQAVKTAQTANTTITIGGENWTYVPATTNPAYPAYRCRINPNTGNYEQINIEPEKYRRLVEPVIGPPPGIRYDNRGRQIWRPGAMVFEGNSIIAVNQEIDNEIASLEAEFTTLVNSGVAAILRNHNPVASDIDWNGIVDADDYIAFVNSFGTEDIATDPLADVNGDLIIDADDWVAFVNSFGCGC